MRAKNLFCVLCVMAVASLLLGCMDDTTDLKQKVADIEKRLQKQEKDLKDFAGKIGPQRDFSADLQRIEEQQEQLSQAVKTKVDPMNNKLEELRDWAQDAQKDRESVAGKIKSLDQSLGELKKKFDADSREVAKLQKEVASFRKSSGAVAKQIEDLTKGVAEVRKELLDNNTKLVNAVKKVLPKVKEAAVAEIKDRLVPLEEGLSSIKASLETDRKSLAEVKAVPAAADATKEIKALTQRIKELEDVVTTQKSYLLEIGAKLHEVELNLRRGNY
ncbi:MAG: hypothetical protein ACP5M0_05225 [Desulfomonilaceae bacterium]